MTETTTETQTAAVPRLKNRYREEILPALRQEFGFANVMQVPSLTKIVVNMGVGEAARDSKLIEGAVRDLTAITGQKPSVTRADGQDLALLGLLLGGVRDDQARGGGLLRVERLDHDAVLEGLDVDRHF
jgi:Ribosomal protein L5